FVIESLGDLKPDPAESSALESNVERPFHGVTRVLSVVVKWIGGRVTRTNLKFQPRILDVSGWFDGSDSASESAPQQFPPSRVRRRAGFCDIRRTSIGRI
ncbi:hypothetical protein FRC06_003984, partial [Ceratobasidium sp. 370]